MCAIYENHSKDNNVKEKVKFILWNQNIPLLIKNVLCFICC